MTTFYSDKERFLVALDCVIFGFHAGELHLLLLQRNFEPAKGKWSVMGGFLEKDESPNDAAGRVLENLTGLNQVYMEQVGIFGEVNRDPGERVLSVAFYALIDINDSDRELVKQHNAYWVNIHDLPELIFDHKEMVKEALKRLRRKASSEPIGFNLLPELFTLTQLQRLYEVIYNETLDKRNFRKRVAEMDFIEKTEKIDKTGSKRGAALYRFNEKAFGENSKFKL
ncbi:MAG: NUDIX domain-containing protein [Bacteroidaceae bacterium]|nr:NUDIX domain-containing protein [Bacteroidaceae bacterium]MBP9637006.1 NUDIX domain-containing protein [Bacteroidaceae bacterium]